MNLDLNWIANLIWGIADDVLRGQLDKRYGELKSKRLMSDFLTKSEKEAIERTYMDKQDQAYDSQCLAFYTINAPHFRKLTFEAYIEDDGGCVDLKTPYDERDGAFTDHCRRPATRIN